MNLPKISIAIAAVLVSTISIAQVQFESEDWSWEADIPTEDVPSGFTRLELTPEVLDAANRSLSDLRIVNREGRLVPHVKSRPAKATEQKWAGVRLINRTFMDGDFVRVTLDFGGRALKSHLRVALSGENYRRFALLEGSENGSSWSTVDSGWLFHFIDAGTVYDATILRFPPNDFPYLRLTVYNMEDEKDTIDIVKIETSHHGVDDGPQPIPMEVTATLVEPEEDEGNVTIYDLDTGYRNLPLKGLAIDPLSPYFYRRYELLGRDSLTETYTRRTESALEPEERETAWRTIRCGVFYRIERDDGVDEDLSIEGFRQPYRYLRLRILNGDDAPLDLALQDLALTRGAYSSLLFNHDSDLRYRLYFGNAKASAPQYDLARAVENMDGRELPTVRLGAITQLEVALEAEPLLERYTWAIWVVLVFAVAIMGWLILRNLRHMGVE